MKNESENCKNDVANILESNLNSKINNSKTNVKGFLEDQISTNISNNELDNEIKQIYTYFNQITEIKLKMVQNSQEEKNNLLLDTMKDSLGKNIWYLECSLEKLKKSRDYEKNSQLRSFSEKIEKFINFHKVLGIDSDLALEKLKILKNTNLNINEQIVTQNTSLELLKEKVKYIHSKVVSSFKKMNNLVMKTSHVSLYITLGIETITILLLCFI